MYLVPGDLQILCSYGNDDTVRVWHIEDSSHPVLLQSFSNIKNMSNNDTYFLVHKISFKVISIALGYHSMANA